MSRVIDILRAVGACLAGVGLLLLAVNSLRGGLESSRQRPLESEAEASSRTPEIPAPTTPEMAALRSHGVQRIEQIATSGSFDRKDSEDLRELYERLDQGGKMTLAVSFGREFSRERIRIDDPSLIPF